MAVEILDYAIHNANDGIQAIGPRFLGKGRANGGLKQSGVKYRRGSVADTTGVAIS